MNIKSLGRTGLKVTDICLGTMTFGNQADQATAFQIMDVADQAGINFIDTADVYPLGGDLTTAGRTEEIVGNWLQERKARDRIILATKCRGRMGAGPNDEGLSRRHVIKACEDSLRRLQTDYIDLYQTHAPDLSTPIEESMRAFDDLVRSGKVRYIGCSNYPAWQLAESLWTSDKYNLARFESAQPRYNLLFRMIEDEIVPLCQKHGVGMIVYNPIAGGVLTERYQKGQAVESGTRFALKGAGEMYRKRYWNDAVFEEVSALREFLQPRGKSITHVALAWVMAQPGITSAIVGASKPEQLRDTLQGASVKLDAEEMARIDEVWFSLPRERDPFIARR